MYFTVQPPSPLADFAEEQLCLTGFSPCFWGLIPQPHVLCRKWHGSTNPFPEDWEERCLSDPEEGREPLEDLAARETG